LSSELKLKSHGSLVKRGKPDSSRHDSDPATSDNETSSGPSCAFGKLLDILQKSGRTSVL